MQKLNLIVFGDYPWTVSFIKQVIASDKFIIKHVFTSKKHAKTATEQYVSQHMSKHIELHVVEKVDQYTIVELQKIDFDLILSVAFSKIFNQAFLEAFDSKLLNIHPSPLPLGRGPDPIRHAILNSDPQFGVTLHLIDTGIDTGDIVGQWLIKNDGTMDCGEILQSLLNKVVKYLPVTLSEYLKGKIVPQVQADSLFYAHSLDEESLTINHNDSYEIALNKYRACSPFRPTMLTYKGKVYSFKGIPRLDNFVNATKFSLSEADIYLEIDLET